MPKELDLRGLNCPEPAIRTGKALRDVDELIVIVDDESATQNISRGVENRGYGIKVEQVGKDYYLHIRREQGTEEGDIEFDMSCATGPTVVFFPADTIGRGDDELGYILTKSIIYSFLEVEPKPETIIFMNSGVRLAVEGSEALADLQALQDQGVDILVCGTCLDFFKLKDKLAIGEMSNAYTIAETLLDAGKIVRF
ncbi:MAG: sulfurtransferase-like selenium metabolism protein YedF [Thermoplasmata archaeon]|nr:sulfurtransferase-like selenium metabolism protein YedF [Thermoplasmata archaeon]